MPRTNFRVFREIYLVLLLITTTNLTSIAVPAYAAPPIDEIRAIIKKKALKPQSATSLAALDIKNLDKSLLAIDPYACYVPSSKRSKASALPAYLGIEVFCYQSRLWIRPDAGGPADQAGIPEIGELKAINGKKINGDDLDHVSAQIDKAVRDNRVFITVSGHPGKRGKNYRVKPVVFQPASVTWRRVGADVVIRINEFVAHDTAPCLAAIYTTVVRSGNKVILDLRGCTGGDLYEALEIAGMFVPADLPMAITYDRSGVVQTYRSPRGKKLGGAVWVLIDHRTASAAEILAGILKYHHRAYVEGERSFGKCLSQTLFPLSDGGELWLTTLGIDFPDNTSCTDVGIKPDIPYPDISVGKLTDIIRKIGNGALGVP